MEYRKWYPAKIVKDAYEYHLNDSYTIILYQSSNKDNEKSYTVYITNNYGISEAATIFYVSPSEKIETIQDYSLYRLISYFEQKNNKIQYFLNEIKEAYES